MEDCAKKDPLTGLLNKTVTEEMVSLQLGKPEEKCALFIVDIDNFKNVNDTLGHLYGDAALSEIAHAIKGVFRDSDVMGRIGGDEFLVCMGLPNIKKNSDAFDLQTEVGKGTTIKSTIYFQK